MDDSDLAAGVDTNYWESFRLMAAGCGGDVREQDGVLSVATGAPLAMLNIAFVTKPLRDPGAQLEQAAAFFDERRLPFVVRIREGFDPASEEAATALGMPYSDTVPGMAMYPITAAPPAPAGLEIRTVIGGNTLAEFQHAVAEGYGMPPSIAELLMTEELAGLESVEMYVGMLDGAAVAASTLVVTASAAGVYNVATVSGFRRRGIGEAMTWHCMVRGVERGCSFAVLQSSTMGQPVYSRMGFRVVAPYRTFHRPEY